MRPLKLALKNFTAFRDEQIIDFAGLDLFALSGPVGSGKSSVLDAMTYALYGRVERVGDEPRLLVSQGQPRMAVTFDFRAGDQDVRVMRTTQASGSSKVLVERRVGDEYVSFGEGADQIRSANKLILEIVGLDYDAFTRSVVLPQGKFAQFLVGDPVTRRKMLTELLGLELFERMAKRSNEIAIEAKAVADTTQALLDSSYGDVSPERLGTIRTQEEAIAVRVASLQEIEKELHDHVERTRTVTTTIERVATAEQRIRDLAGRFVHHLQLIRAAVLQLQAEQEQIAAAQIDVEKATDALEGARSDLEKAQRHWGGRDPLVALRERIARWEQSRVDAEEAIASHSSAQDRSKAARRKEVAGRKAVEEAKKAAKVATALAAEKKGLLERAHTHDLVASLTADLKRGAPCPVCETPLRRLPKVDADELKKAQRELKLAEAEDRRAQKEHADAHTQQLLLAKAVETADADRNRCLQESERRSEIARQLAADIQQAFGEEMPADPAAEVQRRIGDLDDLAAAVAEATERLDDTERALAERRDELARTTSRIDLIRVAIEESSVRAAFAEACDAASIKTDHIPPTSVPTEAAELERYTAGITTGLQDLNHRLGEERSRLAEEKKSLEAQALASLPKDMLRADSLTAALDVVTRALRSSNDELTRLLVTAEQLEKDIAKKQRLLADAAGKREEHELYRTLGRELQKNRIVDYLQAEALKTLAAFASERLHDLSGGRYRLAFENENFCVIDGWNGDEYRRVNTLSGGETFLASLALALALSEQVQLLAVTERHRLESLFLDEGFGSLDPETLEVVVAAIEQLGGEDRLVGVITHVGQVAERMPARIEIVKSPRGSTLVAQHATA